MTDNWAPPVPTVPATSAFAQWSDAAGRVLLHELTYSELESWCVNDLGEKPTRAGQLFKALYKKVGQRSVDEGQGPTANSFDDWPVAAAFKTRLSGLASLAPSLKLEQQRMANDGTRKLGFRVLRGQGQGSLIESVLIPGANGRSTLCVSSQVGCALNCQFCSTGRMGLRGNLSTGQIVEQLLTATAICPVSNVVFMGQGEPLANEDAVLRAVDIMLDGRGLAMSPARVTVSTSGLVPQIRRLLRETRASLAVSLNATTDEVRSWIMPINRRYNLAALMACLRQELTGHDAPPHRRGSVAFLEYVMLAGVNDGLEDAERFIALAAGIPCKLNLICYNEFAGTIFRPSGRETILAFRNVVARAGITCTIRESRGGDETAACGQLSTLSDAATAGDAPPPPMMRPPPRFRDQFGGSSLVPMKRPVGCT